MPVHRRPGDAEAMGDRRRLTVAAVTATVAWVTRVETPKASVVVLTDAG